MDGHTLFRELKKILAALYLLPALLRITNPEPGSEEPFRKLLQRKLKEKQRMASLSPNAAALPELFAGDQGMEVDEE